MVTIILEIIGISISLVSALWIFFRRVNKHLEKIDKMDKKLDKHIVYDIKDKIRDRYYYLRDKVEDGRPVLSLELKDAFDLVMYAKENKVNGETEPMQDYIVSLYNEKLIPNMNKEVNYD